MSDHSNSNKMSHFHSELKQIIEKYEQKSADPQNQKEISNLLSDMRQLLQSKELDSETTSDSLKNKFKQYVVSTLKFSSLSKMISGVAHEINTPLAIIQIRTDQLVEATEANEFNQETFQKSLTSIDQTAKRIGSIVTRLRAYSKSLNTSDISKVSLKKLIEDTTALTRDHFLTDGVTLELQLPEKDCEIECCPSDISQALLNLLNNSFTALHGQDEKFIRVSYLTQDNLVLIDVVDSGPGIPVPIRSQIFEPFFTTSTSQNHLGLGLSIARDYVLAHHGNLTLDESSTSTKFTISLPLPKSIQFEG